MPKKKRLSEYIVEDIRNMLKNGIYKKGDKLPNQNEFAKQLGVSRLSLREALQMLEIMGVVEQRPKAGTIILKPDPNEWGQPYGKFVLRDESDTRQMLFARKCLEPIIMEEALKRITTAYLDGLTKIYYEIYEACRVNDVERFLAKDMEFHIFIAEACGNWYLLNMYKLTLEQVDIFMKDVFAAIPEAFEKAVRVHRKIYEAFIERHSGKLKSAATAHSNYIAQLIQVFFKKPPPEANKVDSLYYP